MHGGCCAVQMHVYIYIIICNVHADESLVGQTLSIAYAEVGVAMRD